MSEFRPQCPVCAEQGVTPERIDDLGGYSTLLYVNGFYDTDGKFHKHNRNKQTENFRCSNDHHFSQIVPHSCWCGWEQEL